MHRHNVDRGSDNGRNTAAREDIIIWKIADEEQAEVGRSIEQEFQTQVTPRTSASDYSFFRQRKDHSPSTRVAHLRATRGCPRPVRRDHPSSDLTASTKIHSEIAGSVILPSFGEHKTSVVEVATTNCKYINKGVFYDVT
ncbi:hypothetical protein VPH35_136283 [Triticum aestivum]|uniref:Uncharacterized protein n=1 Tax=Aegilops tauschii TaxID=37682 RepID=N1R217_AEGTA